MISGGQSKKRGGREEGETRTRGARAEKERSTSRRREEEEGRKSAQEGCSRVLWNRNSSAPPGITAIQHPLFSICTACLLLARQFVSMTEKRSQGPK
eukprot:3528589-Rhodomonas_salina.4